jgi:D-alanine--poly(phosphoribitol) ligase subunit 2
VTDPARAVREFVIAKIQAAAAGKQRTVEELGDDFSLTESGLFDSVGFVELLLALETEFGIEVDFEALDPEEFMTLGGIVQSVIQNVSDDSKMERE